MVKNCAEKWISFFRVIFVEKKEVIKDNDLIDKDKQWDIIYSALMYKDIKNE